MYKILGGDGREYGPVNSDTIREWIIQGRANASTLVRHDAEDWKPLAAFPEFSAALSQSPASAPPPLPGYASSLGQNPAPRIQTYLIPSIIATLCCCPVFGIPAIIFAAMAHSRISDGDYEGARKAAKKAAIFFWLAIAFGIIGGFLSSKISTMYNFKLPSNMI